MSTRELTPEPLTQKAFRPFGDVIGTEGAERFFINEGTAERFHDLATLDVAAAGGRPVISIFRSRPRPSPLEVTMMERHPLGSQAFIPLDRRPYVVVVAPAGNAPTAASLRAFRAAADQGVNFRPGVWHHPLLVFDEQRDFLVIDRGGPGDNLDEIGVTGGTAVLVGWRFSAGSAVAGQGPVEPTSAGRHGSEGIDPFDKRTVFGTP